MSFHGLLLIRDEIDILPETLPAFLSWCDSVTVFDLGSTDGTWEYVLDLARKDSRLIPFERRPVVYSDDLRCVPFHFARERFRDGDWVVKLDADEFFHDDPREFVRERLRWFESVVYLQWYYFRLTEREVADWESGKVTIADRSRPIAERRTTCARSSGFQSG